MVRFGAKIVGKLIERFIWIASRQKKEAMPNPSFLGIAPSKPGRLSA